MKFSIIALSVAALLAFGVANASMPVGTATTAAPAAPVAKPATPAAKPAAAAATPAAAPAKILTPQQQKMGACSTANKGKKGADYKAGMSSCLKGGAATPAAAAPAAAAAAPVTQQDRMKSCNADAGKQALKADARKTFMSDCLKKK